jgi:16S rRNA processing protein RimM
MTKSGPAPEAPVKRDAETVVLGRIVGVFGVRGWVKVFSHTEPRDNILTYSPWLVREGGSWKALRLLDGKPHGKGMIALLEGCTDRDRAALLLGCDIAVERERLPRLEQDDYYWSDLEGLRVRTLEGEELGVVSHLFETGANDVMVVAGEREHLIPYLWHRVVKQVDLEAGLILVDWDPDF